MAEVTPIMIKKRLMSYPDGNLPNPQKDSRYPFKISSWNHETLISVYSLWSASHKTLHILKPWYNDSFCPYIWTWGMVNCYSTQRNHYVYILYISYICINTAPKKDIACWRTNCEGHFKSFNVIHDISQDALRVCKGNVIMTYFRGHGGSDGFSALAVLLMRS